MARELKIGDRVVDWKDRAGVVLSVGQNLDGEGQHFSMRRDDGSERHWDWHEFDESDADEWEGTFRFEDTEYPEWPN